MEALEKIKESQSQNPESQSQNPETHSDARSLLKSILDIRFILCLVAWAEILKEINRVNKENQKNKE